MYKYTQYYYVYNRNTVNPFAAKLKNWFPVYEETHEQTTTVFAAAAVPDIISVMNPVSSIALVAVKVAPPCYDWEIKKFIQNHNYILVFIKIKIIIIIKITINYV